MALIAHVRDKQAGALTVDANRSGWSEKTNTAADSGDAFARGGNYKPALKKKNVAGANQVSRGSCSPHSSSICGLDGAFKAQTSPSGVEAAAMCKSS